MGDVSPSPSLFILPYQYGMSPSNAHTYRDLAQRRKACEYCARRKMKCDMAEPTCSNCIKHGKRCIPVARTERPRPTHNRIAELDANYQRLLGLVQEAASMEPESSQHALRELLRTESSGSTRISVPAGSLPSLAHGIEAGSSRSGSAAPIATAIVVDDSSPSEVSPYSRDLCVTLGQEGMC